MRAADFASLTSLLAAADAIETERERIETEAKARVDAAQAEAKQRLAAAVAEAKQSGERGYAEGLARGREEAASQWAAESLREGASAKRRLMRQTQRLSEIVSSAVERVVEQEDRTALYKRALRSITRVMKDAPLLTLRVSQDDEEHARQALDSVLEQGDVPTIELVCDAVLAPGSCLFESDLGVVDAGLETQLAAIKRACARAARETAVAADDPGIDPEDAHGEDVDVAEASVDADVESLAEEHAVDDGQDTPGFAFEGRSGEPDMDAFDESGDAEERDAFST